MIRFNKYAVALKLTQEKVGRKEVLNEIFNKRFIDTSREVYEYIKFLKKEDIDVVASYEDLYPSLLKEISDYPLLLFCKGDISLLKKYMITIVGTRKISEYGKWVVRYLLKPFENNPNIIVVSGLARGVDSYVHKTCLEFNIPTIGVVAGGINKGYPKSNQYIYDEMVKKGLIISEFPPNRSVCKGMFPMRNRILAGISLATVVIESDITGGSLITVNLALEYGREIFAVPCNIDRYSLQGCNTTILEGATPLFLQEQLVNFCGKL
ncbi:MAG: DNA-processing protein DprA [Candidatus Dojkabacteria bacterium]|nr:DNA-processing protein DprA [Candidatus Dojkabacteria bacterium]